MKSICYFLILIASIVNLTSCLDTEDPIIVDCPEACDAGQFFFNESFKSIPPYSNEDRFLVFSDSLGNEITGKLTLGSFGPRQEFNGIINCEQDPNSLYYEYSYIGERRESILEFTALNLNFTFLNHVIPNFTSSTHKIQSTKLH